MEIFKSTVLNNEFDELVKEIILTLENVGDMINFSVDIAIRSLYFVVAVEKNVVKTAGSLLILQKSS